MMPVAELRTELANCYGSENWYKHMPFGMMLYTDGVKILAEGADAYWLIDLIASYQSPALDEKCDGMQVWKLKLNDPTDGAKGFVVTCTNGHNDKPIITQKEDFTNFPLPEITIWVEGVGRPIGRGINGRVALLPSEH